MSSPSPTPRYILTLSCPSAAGQVAAVTSFLEARGCYIEEISVFDDSISQSFFVRCVFHAADGGALPLEHMRADFAPVGRRFQMNWQIADVALRSRVLILVSRYDHCLNDLLYRWRVGELKIDIAGVVSNHPDLRGIAAAHDLPFHHLPVTPDTRKQQEAQLLHLVEQTRTDLVVLARYMQVLSAELSDILYARAINIHHSFLPGFKGAKPYHQAYARGVKLIGATAHYVTSDLDEGPIIEQVVDRVDHSSDPDHLLAVGRDMECLALSRAVKLHIERRVFLNGNKTIVLR